MPRVAKRRVKSAHTAGVIRDAFDRRSAIGESAQLIVLAANIRHLSFSFFFLSILDREKRSTCIALVLEAKCFYIYSIKEGSRGQTKGLIERQTISEPLVDARTSVRVSTRYTREA